MKALGIIVALLVAGAGVGCNAQQQSVSQDDDIRISLLTCSSFEAVYALYGHTAIRVEDPSQGVDIAVNYGVFSFDKPFFVARFVLGLTDYEMGVEPFSDMMRKYRHYRCSITQQELDLTIEEKRALLAALAINYLPDNRVYRYNYFYDNCTTRARDIIAANLQGHIDYDKGDDFSGPPFRDIVHSCTDHRPWTRFGIDLLLGVAADRPTTLSEYQFLPANLMADFDGASITGADGSSRRLVSRRATVLKGGWQEPVSGFPLRPTISAIIILAVSLLLTAVEIRSTKGGRHVVPVAVVAFDALLMVACGLTGIILFAMLFSEHPTVRVNLQLLLLNPLPLFFVYRMVRRARQGRHDWQHYLWAVLIVLFFLGNLIQHYAEGINILALSLLVRQVKLRVKN